MNTLTPSEQEIVNKESKKKSHAYDYSDHRTTYREGFQEGVEFALRELVKGRMTGFAEWCGDNYFHDDANNWQDRWNGEHFTTKQLYDKHIQEHLKQKEDGTRG